MDKQSTRFSSKTAILNPYSDFESQFEIVYASEQSMKRVAYSLRHQVYCVELADNATQKHGMDIDQYDRYSHHILIKHRDSGLFIGTIRLVVPKEGLLSVHMPIEDIGVGSEWVHRFNPANLTGGSFCEISRIAIPIRPDVCQQSLCFLGKNTQQEPSKLTPQDIRSYFPTITIALYLSSLGLARMLFQDHVFAMMPPMMYKKLRGQGLLFGQASHCFEFEGSKAIYYINLEEGSGIAGPMIELYEMIMNQLSSQLHLFPTIEESGDLGA